MFNQLFGANLVKTGVLTEEQMRDLLDRAANERVKLGTIAIAEGLLTENEAESINQMQAQYDKRFGDIAIEKGYLTEDEVSSLVAQQGNPFMKFIQLLFEDNLLTPLELDEQMVAFQDALGFTEDDMDALKHENVDQIVQLFAFSSKPYVTELIALLLRNITRFISDDYYIGKLEKVDEFICSNMVMQRIFGDHTIYLGLATDQNTDGFLSVASKYAKESYDEVTPYVYDALNEFINITSGLFATKLSQESVTMDMEPPLAYANQIVQGNGYILPVYYQGCCLNVYIAVNSSLVLARNPLDLQIDKRKGGMASINSRGRVVIVDDSALTRKILRELLEGAGYTVVCEAVNGQEAVETYQKYQPDVITLDITMPVMDGVEALRQILKLDPDAKAMMITAAGQEKKVIEAIQIGATHFVVKPFDNQMVLDNIQEFFK